MTRLEIQTVGKPEYPRFIIATKDGEVFDGRGWTRDRNRAALYTCGQEVAARFNSLQEAMCQDWPIREFTVTLNIRVRSAAPFTQKELEEYMEQATSIFLDQEKGTGPVDESMVQLAVTWREMKEKADSTEMEKR
jgi:hypothetical protein